MAAAASTHSLFLLFSGWEEHDIFLKFIEKIKEHLICSIWVRFPSPTQSPQLREYARLGSCMYGNIGGFNSTGSKRTNREGWRFVKGDLMSSFQIIYSVSSENYSGEEGEDIAGN
jgi:hypothetical protein